MRAGKGIQVRHVLCGDHAFRWMPWSPKGASMLRRDMMGLMASMLSMMRMLGCFALYRTSSSSHSAGNAQQS